MIWEVSVILGKNFSVTLYGLSECVPAVSSGLLLVADVSVSPLLSPESVEPFLWKVKEI